MYIRIIQIDQNNFYSWLFFEGIRIFGLVSDFLLISYVKCGNLLLSITFKIQSQCSPQKLQSEFSDHTVTYSDILFLQILHTLSNHEEKGLKFEMFMVHVSLNFKYVKCHSHSGIYTVAI